jgi:polyphosphate glucokinase
MEILGIDIGGSGIKGAPVNIETGTLVTERHRIDTPQPSTPEAVGDVVAEIAAHFAWTGAIGCTFPAVVKDGVVRSAANVDKSWIDFDGQTLLAQKTNLPLILLNDADAAGIAEMEFGAGKGHGGVVILLTFGTGIGTAIFINGVLLPNTELGHLEMHGKDAERFASDYARRKKEMEWDEWAKRVNEYLYRIEFLFSPDLIIVGGGVSKKHEKFLPLLHTRAPIVPAQLLNDAGIVGAAMAARTLA